MPKKTVSRADEPKLSTPRDRTKTTAAKRRGSPPAAPRAPIRKAIFAGSRTRSFAASAGDEAEL